MKIKNIGSQGILASELGLGCMGMSEFYGTRNDDESIRTIHYAIDHGITFLDTADMYGPFHNEELLGKALQGIRTKVTLATKFGIVREAGNNQVRGLNAKPEYVQQACEASLRRLKTDCIDLYYLHRVDPATPVEETVQAMASLVKQGKVRGIGLSEVTPETLRMAHAIHPVSAVQSEYSLWSREPEEGMLDTCKELGIGFVAYSPLGRGFLTGQIRRFEDLGADDYRRFSPRFQGENFTKNLDLVEKIALLAKQKGCTTTQLAIAWVMSGGEHIFPIPGTKRISFLEENLGSLQVKLSKEELSEIDAIAPKGAAAGLRYPAAAMSSVSK